MGGDPKKIELISLLLAQGTLSKGNVGALQIALKDAGFTKNFDKYHHADNAIGFLTSADIVDFCRQNPEVLLTMSQEMKKTLINKGFGGELRSIVDANPDVKEHILHQIDDLKTAGSAAALGTNLERFQANATLLGLYDNRIDGDPGPDSRTAFASFTGRTGADIAPPEKTHSPAPARTSGSKIVFWGDSIAKAAGNAALSRRDEFGEVINLGKDGAGFRASTKLQDWSSVPKGSTVIMYVGTNDIGYLSSDKQITAYAEMVVRQAVAMRDKGLNPVILGLNAPEGAYTGNKGIWERPGFLENWISKMEKLNAEYERIAKDNGISFAATDAQITPQMISKDNLHPNQSGSLALANIGIRASMGGAP